MFKKIMVAVMAVIAGLVAQANQALAALDLTGVSVDTTDFETIAVFVIGALVIFWGIRKGISLLGR